MLVGRRSLLVGSCAVVAGALLPNRAWATVSRPLSLGELVHGSRHALLGKPVDAASLWETVGGRRRIVTYSVIAVERSLDGRNPAREVTVRTLGGRVGDIGQIVHGEAELYPEQPAALFLSELGRDVFVVTGMAQGHYPLRRASSGEPRLRMSSQVEENLRVPGSAVRHLDGKTVLEAERLISRELFESR